MEVRKVDRQRRKSSKPSPQMVRRQPAKKRRKVPMWLWLGWGSVGVISAATVALLAILPTWAPLKQRTLSAADAAFFNQNKDAFSRSLLQVPEVSKPVNILLLGIKTNLSDT